MSSVRGFKIFIGLPEKKEKQCLINKKFINTIKCVNSNNNYILNEITIKNFELKCIAALDRTIKYNLR